MPVSGHVAVKVVHNALFLSLFLYISFALPAKSTRHFITNFHLFFSLTPTLVSHCTPKVNSCFGTRAMTMTLPLSRSYTCTRAHIHYSKPWIYLHSSTFPKTFPHQAEANHVVVTNKHPSSPTTRVHPPLLRLPTCPQRTGVEFGLL